MPIMASGQLTLVDINDSKQLQLYIKSSQPKTQIYNPDNGTYTPSWATSKPVLTPEMFIAGTTTDIISQAKSVKWFVDGVEITASTTDYTIGTGAVKTVTINTNVLSTDTAKVFACEVIYTDPDTTFDITSKAEIEFIKVASGVKGATGASGANAVMGVLSNDSQAVPTDSAGNNGNFSGAVTTISIFEGATDVSASWAVSAVASSGVTGSLSGKTYTVTAMTVDAGYIDLTATRSGYASVVKRFNLTKAKAGATGATGGTGATGASATAYWLVSSVSAIGKNISNVYTPASVSFSAMAQTGAGTPTAYAGRFIIAESTDGTAFTDKYTSTSNEATKAYTQSAGIKALRVRLYLAGGTTTLLDEQVIPIVVDGATGAKGADAVRAVVWTPDGNVIKNGSGSLKAKCDVYSGASLVTATTYQWFAQDPTQSTDVGGGIGWKKLDATYNMGTTGYATNTLTIPATAILGVESFKCVATYSAITYSDVCTVSDVSDPIQVTVVGTSVFKNGQGSTTLTAKLYQSGLELDSAGTGFTYTWYLYDANNNKVGTWSKTGKTITVLADDVNVRGNVVCEVSN